MSILVALMAAALSQAAEGPQTGELYDAIWNDLELNGFIGNGNDLGGRWYNAADGKGPVLHIRELSCHRRRLLGGYGCSFTLIRDGGVATVLDKPVPDRIACSAVFVREGQSPQTWQIKHLPPPPHGGHSRTTMTCRVAPSPAA
jgi:hypothetical protein